MSTVLHRLVNWSNEAPNQVAQKYRSDGGWKDITAREYCDRVFYLALYLEKRGFKKGDVSVIFSYNCPEWVHMDLAPLMLGGISCGLYPNSNHKDIDYILKNTEAKILSVQNAAYYKKIVGEKGQYSFPDSVEIVFSFDGDTSFHPKAVGLQAAIAEGKKIAGSRTVEEFTNNINKSDGAFLIYTSGTTGNPKGALLSHDNLSFCSDLAINQFRLTSPGSMFSFLPLCHIAEKMQNVGVGICGRFTIYFCTGIDFVGKELPSVQPTVLLCVPRLWEKMMEGVEHKLEQAPPTKKKLAKWAFGLGQKVAEAKFGGTTLGLSDVVMHKVAEKLVIGKIRQALGLAQIQAAASGAAALSEHLEKWFRSIGIYILNTYGQTESTGIITMAAPGEDCAGTIGKPAPDTEFRIAEDGEILTKGRHVFIGYFKNEQATRETVINGWLHTGDLGEIDSRGRVRIKGRKKEIMKSSGGKMVAPVPIEERVKESPLVSQVCMVGDGKKYFSALVTLSATAMPSNVNGNNVINDPTLQAEVKKVFDRVNGELASFEQIKKFAILAREFSVDAGEMTPTLKMKRNVIEQNYKDVIEGFYN